MRKLLLIIISIVWAFPMLADDFNPANPPDPYTKYKVITSATPVGYTSGGGSYLPGTEISISTSSAGVNYTFSHWTKNGEFYTNAVSFRYTVEPQTTEFVAVYEYNPANPSDPQATNQYRLYLTTNIPSACSFNRTSGEKLEAGTNVTISVYSSNDYNFLGWYEGDNVISNALSFRYRMPEKNVTLEARFMYNPFNPGDPDSGNGDDVATSSMGDVNEDGFVNKIDVQLVVDYILGKQVNINTTLADMDNNSKISISDVNLIIAKCQKKQKRNI